MDQKRILYTFGSLTSFQSHTLSDFSQQKTQVPNLAYQPTLHNISTTQPIAKSDLQVYPFKSASGTQPCLKKYKIIKKPAKGKEVCAAGGNCAKQTVLYKFLKRRLYASQNKFETRRENETSFDLTKIMDWLMQASQNLRLSKDTFYTAVQITKKFYSISRNQLFSHQIIEAQVAGILSLAAKLDSNKINFVEAISVVCGFKKSDVIDCEIYVMKALGFRFPYIRVHEHLLSVCIAWNDFLKENSQFFKMDRKKLEFGSSTQIAEWPALGKAHFVHMSCIFDMVAISLCHKTEYECEKMVENINLQALFLFINYQGQQFFPIKPTQKTHSVMIYENFMKDRFGYKLNDFNEWLAELITNQQRFSFREKICKYFGTKNYYQGKQDISQANTRSCSQMTELEVDYFAQIYNKNILN